MDANIFVTIGSGVSGCVLGGFVVYGILKRYINIHMEKAIKLRYDKELEEHKSSLQRQVNDRLDEIQRVNQIENDRLLADRELYRRFVDLLPSAGPIVFLREIGPSFPMSRMEPFRDFIETWNVPEYCFHDPDIEVRKKQLYDAVGQFSEFISRNYFTMGPNHTNIGIPPERKDENYPKLIDELSMHVHNVIKMHESFVIIARENLRI